MKSSETERTCNHEHDSSDHSCCGFAPRLAVHEVSALHSYCGDQHGHDGEEIAEYQHSPGRLDLSW